MQGRVNWEINQQKAEGTKGEWNLSTVRDKSNKSEQQCGGVLYANIYDEHTQQKRVERGGELSALFRRGVVTALMVERQWVTPA